MVDDQKFVVAPIDVLRTGIFEIFVSAEMAMLHWVIAQILEFWF
jgi:hypothetical protein